MLVRNEQRERDVLGMGHDKEGGFYRDSITGGVVEPPHRPLRVWFPAVHRLRRMSSPG